MIFSGGPTKKGNNDDFLGDVLEDLLICFYYGILLRIIRMIWIVCYVLRMNCMIHMNRKIRINRKIRMIMIRIAFV
jgi:hypothetical protein